MIEFFDRPIAFHRSFVTITGSATTALMLSQVVYWSLRTKDKDGWFYKSQEEWQEETGLNRTEQEKARNRLKSLKFLEEKKEGIPSKLHYRLCENEINDALKGIKKYSLEEVLTIDAETIAKISKAALMRAKKSNPESHSVDYADVLKQKGMWCGLCNSEIAKLTGDGDGCLTFEYAISLNKGGLHEIDNIFCVHVGCVRKASNDAKSSLLILNRQQGLNKTDSEAYSKQTARLKQNEQQGLNETDYLYTEITSETTSYISPESEKKAALGFQIPEPEPTIVNRIEPEEFTTPIARIEPQAKTNFPSRRSPQDVSWQWLREASPENAPWLTENAKLDPSFHEWVAKQWLQDFADLRGDIHKAKMRVMQHFKKDPANLAIQWEHYASIHRAYFESAKLRLDHGIEIKEDEQIQLMANVKAIASPLSEELSVSESKALNPASENTPISLSPVQSTEMHSKTEIPEGADNVSAYQSYQLPKNEEYVSLAEFKAKIAEFKKGFSSKKMPDPDPSQPVSELEQLNEYLQDPILREQAIQKIKRSGLYGFTFTDYGEINGVVLIEYVDF